MEISKTIGGLIKITHKHFIDKSELIILQEAPPGTQVVDSVAGHSNEPMLWLCQSHLLIKSDVIFLKDQLEYWIKNGKLKE